MRIEPETARVGGTATLIATGYTPLTSGSIAVDDPEQTFVNSLFHSPGDVPFNADGTFQMTFDVEFFLAGRHVIDVTDSDPEVGMPCYAVFVWTVLRTPETSTEPSQRGVQLEWLPVLAGLAGFGLAFQRLRPRRV